MSAQDTPLLEDYPVARPKTNTSLSNSQFLDQTDDINASLEKIEVQSRLTLEISSFAAGSSTSSFAFNIPSKRAVVVHYWNQETEANHFYHQFNLGRGATVRDLIAMSLEYFETVVKTSEDTELYELRFANKSGQPKEDLPGEN